MNRLVEISTTAVETKQIHRMKWSWLMKWFCFGAKPIQNEAKNISISSLIAFENFGMIFPLGKEQWTDKTDYILSIIQLIKF